MEPPSAMRRVILGEAEGWVLSMVLSEMWDARGPSPVWGGDDFVRVDVC